MIQYLLIPKQLLLAWNIRGNPRCVVANMQCCDIVVSEFELQSRYCVYFPIYSLGKGRNSVIFQMVKEYHCCVFTRMTLPLNNSFNITYEISWYVINQRYQKQNQKWKVLNLYDGKFPCLLSGFQFDWDYTQKLQILRLVCIFQYQSFA